MGDVDVAARGLFRIRQAELSALRKNDQPLDDAGVAAGDARRRTESVTHVARAENHHGGAGFFAVSPACGHDARRHRFVATHLGLKHRLQFCRIHRHVDREFLGHDLFVSRILGDDFGRQLAALFGRQFGQSAAAAHGADDGRGGVDAADRDAVLAGELDQGAIVRVVAPLFGPVDFPDEAVEIDFAPVVALNRRLIPRFELLEAEDQFDPAGEQLLQDPKLEFVVPRNRVGLPEVDDVGARQLVEHVAVGDLLTVYEVDPQLRARRM